jgi:hypothetical protein
MEGTQPALFSPTCTSLGRSRGTSRGQGCAERNMKLEVRASYNSPKHRIRGLIGISNAFLGPLVSKMKRSNTMLPSRVTYEHLPFVQSHLLSSMAFECLQLSKHFVISNPANPKGLSGYTSENGDGKIRSQLLPAFNMYLRITDLLRSPVESITLLE